MTDSGVPRNRLYMPFLQEHQQQYSVVAVTEQYLSDQCEDQP